MPGKPVAPTRIAQTYNDFHAASPMLMRVPMFCANWILGNRGCSERSMAALAALFFFGFLLTDHFRLRRLFAFGFGRFGFFLFRLD